MTRKIILRQGGTTSDSEGDIDARALDSARSAARADAGEARKINPMDSVYSFLMFTLPMEQMVHGGKLTQRTVVAILLVVITLLIKGILLYAIFNAVVAKDIRWQNSILKPDSGSIAFLSAPQTKCNTGESLCSETNGVYSCAPPTIQLIGKWNELDTNGDGVWSHEEAVASRDEIKCKYVVDPVEIFDVMVKFIVAREKMIWIHPDVRAGRSIHKSYFTYATGDLIMCGYRNEKMCPNLMQRGIFDAGLRDGVAPRLGTTIDSALDYCYSLLDEGGMCDRNLPSTYAVWKVYTDKQCWGNTYDKFVYTHPANGKQKSMLSVDYKAPKAYARVSNNTLFRLYKGIIIGLFLLAMYHELKDVATAAIWVVCYPAAKDNQDTGVIQTVGTLSKEASFEIQSISKPHRYAIGAVTVLRFFMVVMLIWVGVSFLMRDTSWVELLLNGVAMVFIMEIASSIFTQVLDPHLQEQFLSTEPMYVDSIGFKWMNTNPAVRDILAFSSLCLFMAIVMHIHLIVVDRPLSEAVECACLSQGGKCHEASAFDHHFWNKYWSEDVPDVFSTVEQLKVAAATGRPIAQIKAQESTMDEISGASVNTAAAATLAPAALVPPTPAPSPPAPPPSPPPKRAEEKVPARRVNTGDGVRWNIVSKKPINNNKNQWGMARKPIKKHNAFKLLNKVKKKAVSA